MAKVKRGALHQQRVAVVSSDPPLSPKDTRALQQFMAGWGRGFFTGTRFVHRGSIIRIKQETNSASPKRK